MKLKTTITLILLASQLNAENVFEKLTQSKILLDAALKGATAAESAQPTIIATLNAIPSLTSILDKITGALDGIHNKLNEGLTSFGAHIAGVGDANSFVTDINNALKGMRPSFVKIDEHIQNLTKLINPEAEDPLPLYAALPSIKTNLTKVLEGFNQLEALVKDLQATGLF